LKGFIATSTLFLFVPNVLRWKLTVPNTRMAMVFNVFRLSFEGILCILWSLVFIQMVMPKGKDFRLAFNPPPYGQWIAAVVLAGFEMFVSHHST
jgi:hypothetical protein